MQGIFKQLAALGQDSASSSRPICPAVPPPDPQNLVNTALALHLQQRQAPHGLCEHASNLVHTLYRQHQAEVQQQRQSQGQASAEPLPHPAVTVPSQVSSVDHTMPEPLLPLPSDLAHSSSPSQSFTGPLPDTTDTDQAQHLSLHAGSSHKIRQQDTVPDTPMGTAEAASGEQNVAEVATADAAAWTLEHTAAAAASEVMHAVRSHVG